VIETTETTRSPGPVGWQGEPEPELESGSVEMVMDRWSGIS
jgi:hypothetical protein